MNSHPYSYSYSSHFQSPDLTSHDSIFCILYDSLHSLYIFDSGFSIGFYHSLTKHITYQNGVHTKNIRKLLPYPYSSSSTTMKGFLSLSYDGHVGKWVYNQNKKEYQIMYKFQFAYNGTPSAIDGVCFENNQVGRFVSYCYDGGGYIHLHELEESGKRIKLICETPNGENGLYIDVVDENKKMFVCNIYGFVRLYEIPKEIDTYPLKILTDFKIGKQPTCLVYLSNCRLAVALKDEIKVYDFSNPPDCTCLITYKVSEVNYMYFHRPKFLMVGCKDGLRIFDLYQQKMIRHYNFYKKVVLFVTVVNNIIVVTGEGNKITFITDSLIGGNYYEPKFVKEKIDFFLANDEIYDFEVKLKNKTIKLFKSFFTSSDSSIIQKHVEENNSYEIDKGLNVEQETLLKLFFGYITHIEEKDIFDYYHFLRIFEMKKLCYYVCMEVRTIKKIGNLLKFYEECKIFEKKSGDCVEVDNNNTHVIDYENIDDESSDDESFPDFNCAFTVAIFNEFKSREDDIFKKRKVYQAFEKECLLSRLKKYQPQILENHLEFLGCSFKSCSDSLIPSLVVPIQVNEEILEKLYKSKKYCNIDIQSNDGKWYKAHLEIIFANGTFFEKMFHFCGIEKESIIKKKRLVMEYMNGKVVETYLEFIYLQKISSVDLEVLFSILNHAEMYFEKKLKSCVLTKIEKVLTKIDTDQIISFMKTSGYLIENEKNILEVYQILSDDFTEVIKIDTFLKIVSESCLRMEGKVLKNKMELQEKEIKELKKLISVMNEKLEQQDKRIIKLESLIDPQQKLNDKN